MRHTSVYFLTVSARLPEYTEKIALSRKIRHFCKKEIFARIFLQKCNVKIERMFYFILILFQ